MDYEDAFETDWEELSTDEIIERAYALGVASALGERNPQELDRLQEATDSAYDRNIVELSFQEGRGEAIDYRSHHRSEDDEDVWTELVEEAEEPEMTTVEVETPDELPSSITRPDVLDPPDDDLDAVRLPTFLLRQ